MVRRLLIATCIVTFLVGGSLIPLGLADGGANHQKRNQHFGVSGGNINDHSRAFCCSGTLGALVNDGSTQYVLSNNHVLGRSDQATVGEDISQPGLIDNSCQVATIVADFTTAVPIGNNVDAAIALLRNGTMDGTGFIEDIGVPSSTVVAPSVGLSVAKSGRTTGFTTGSVGSINTSVNVQYQQGCNSGKKFTVSYTNQVVINSSSFSAGGDSGSLIVTNNASHNPVALLFAGSSSTTIGNPIGEVLSKLSARPGIGTLSFGGGGGPAGPVSTLSTDDTVPFIRGGGRQMRELPSQAAARASAVLERHRANLMFMDGVIGAGVGFASDDDNDAAIVIYVDRTQNGRPVLASSIEGIPVRMIMTDPFVAF
jgi:Peptidase family S64